MELILLVLLPVACALGFLVLAHRRRYNPPVSGTMGRGHIARYTRTPPARWTQTEINLAKYHVPGWNTMRDDELWEKTREQLEDADRLSIYDRAVRDIEERTRNNWKDNA